MIVFIAISTTVNQLSSLESFRILNVLKGTILYSQDGSKVVSVWNAPDELTASQQCQVLHKNNIVAEQTKSFHHLGTLIENSLP